MPRSTILANLSCVWLFLPVAVTVASKRSMYVCNRGYCYIKTEPDHLEAQQRHGGSLSSSKRKVRSGLDFCTDSLGNVMDCELFEILGTQSDGEAVECGKACKTQPQDHHGDDSSATSWEESSQDEVMELNEEQQRGHVSWKENPLKGKCFDNDTQYSFDCNLVQILDEGLVLIEDLRAGGVFAAQPKSDFSTQKTTGKLEHNHEPPRTPPVLLGHGGPASEDFRTNVLLNLEGI